MKYDTLNLTTISKQMLISTVYGVPLTLNDNCCSFWGRGGREEGNYLKVYISLIYRFNADKKRHLQSNDHNVIQLPPLQ